MQDERSLPARPAQERSEGRRHDLQGADTAIDDDTAASWRPHPALQPLRDALAAAIRQRVAQRAARDQGTHALLVGHICEQCLDAPAVLVQPAPWGGDMGICAACQQEPPVGDEAPRADAGGRMDVSPTTRGLLPL